MLKHRKQRSPTVPRCLALLFALGLTHACVGAPVDDHLNFQRFTPRDGLPSAVVYCGMQDSRGFLWFGTADGVARFDGRAFRVFRPDPANPDSLRNGAVLEIREDARGDLWMATEGGLERWDRATERFVHFRHAAEDSSSLSDDTTQCLLIDEDGTIWVGTRRGGLEHFDPRTGRFDHLGGMTSGPKVAADFWVRCLYQDRQGDLWIGTGNAGLSRLRRGQRTFEVYSHSEDSVHTLSHNRVSAIAEDATGTLWVATDAGFCSVDPARTRILRHEVEADRYGTAGSQTVTSLVVGRDGVIWIGTDGGGFSRYVPSTGRFTHHRRSKYATNTLVSDKVRAIFESRDGDLWIGHFPAGVSHFDHSSEAFHVFTSVPGDGNTLSDDQVLSFWEDPNGDLWVGTDNGGLNRWVASSGRWKSYTYSADAPNSLGARAAVSVLRDSGGALWVGTWDGGLNRFDPATETFMRYLPLPGQPSALSDSHVWRLAEDRQHRLWVSTIGGGVNRYLPQSDTFVHYRHRPDDPRSINDDTVCALLVGRDGSLWAGTPKGLARYAPATDDWDRFSTATGDTGSLNSHWIFDLLEDRDGIIWATTEGGGLNRVDPRAGTCETVRMSDGLPTDVLHGIAQDDEGALWIGSNRGLIRYDPVSRSIRVFDESNGLPASQFNPHARLRLDTGELLFGTTQGFVRFDPRALKVTPSPPRVVLTHFEIFNAEISPARTGSPLSRSITETHRLEIPARYSVLGFEFAALSYRSTARTRYQVKLEGFDQVWRNLGAENRATFTNLDPGRYRLKIKAANGDGIWSDEGASLDLIIVPPWWRTWWFKSGATLVLLGGTAAAGWSFSNHRLREAQRERELVLQRERLAERERAAEALRTLNQELEARVAERTSRLVAAMKELESFSYSVSHDLRAPLRAMDGFSRALLEDYAGKLDDEGQDNLQRIRAASQRMGQLIDDLLNLSRVSRDELRRGPVDLTGIAVKIAAELSRQYPDKCFDFRIQENMTCTGDARLIQLMLENLLGNACKFSSKKPDPCIEFGTTNREEHRAFFVRDNGAGFDMALSHKLFGPFQRLHSAAEFPGTGIGLATVQRIIQRHGGQITAESAIDRGTTFYFTLPEQPLSTS